MDNSEQSSGFIVLIAVALFAGSLIDFKPIDNDKETCRRWYDYQGRDEHGRASFHYKKSCWRP